MTTIYHIERKRVAGAIVFGFYDFEGDLFAFGNSVEGITLMEDHTYNVYNFPLRMSERVLISDPIRREMEKKFLYGLLQMEEMKAETDNL